MRHFMDGGFMTQSIPAVRPGYGRRRWSRRLLGIV